MNHSDGYTMVIRSRIRGHRETIEYETMEDDNGKWIVK